MTTQITAVKTTPLKAEGLESVDLWIGGPVHWDGLWGAFEAAVPKPYSDPLLEEYLVKSGVRLIKPNQYMDKWRLDLKGVRSVPNDAVKQALGFGKGGRPGQD